jgi:undecaprenyl diphosphate synthase
MIDSLPIHLGIILDGNRRWAKARNLPTLEGHRRGYDKLKDIGKYTLNKGVKYLSAYMFSTENWDRSVREVNYLMTLAQRMITRDLKELNEENIKIVWLGDSAKLSKKLIDTLRKAEELTKNNTKGTLCLCFNYGGKQEVANAVKKIVKNKSINIEDITPELVESNLYAPDVPSIDMVIRTSGEQRLSGFMLWRSAYSELYFVDKHWPDFTTEDIDKAISEYQARSRRFGK